MRLYKLLFWVCLVFILTIWDAITFILALVNRSKSQDACDEANPDQGEGGGGDQSVSVAGYKTTFLGMQLGSTYGLANCAQAVQAGVIGLAILLFVGQIAMVMIIWGWREENRGWLDLLTHTHAHAIVLLCHSRWILHQETQGAYLWSSDQWWWLEW